MNNNAHKVIQEQIDDYILGLLSEKKLRKIESLITDNAEYNRYYLQQMELTGLVQVNNVPDPGAEFWQKFPDQVLEICQQKQEASFWQKCASWWQSQPTQTSFFQPAMAFALILAVVVVLVNPSNRTETLLHDPLAMQNVLWQKNQPTNNMLEPLITRKSHTYSFSKVSSNNAFAAGKDLSLSIAYFKKQDYVQSAKLLEGLKGLKNDEVLDILISSLQQDEPTPPSILIKYKDLLTQMEQRLPADDYTLFMTGSWLTYIEMAIASKQYYLLTELNQSQNILQQLKSQALPESIYSHLQQLDILLKKDQYSREKIAEIKWHISNIQNVLG